MAFAARAAALYDGAMNPARSRFLVIVASAALLSAATGAAFAAWSEHGAEIFLAMAASGLAWCF
jgi:hypothetical protein